MARFGKRAVMGSRVLVGTKSHKCFGGFVDKAVFESDVLVGTISPVSYTHLTLPTKA